MGSQPPDIASGLVQAYDGMATRMKRTAQCVIAVPVAEYQRTGAAGAMRKVIKAVPVAVFTPMIGAAEAVSRVLLGARNALDPAIKYDQEKKYKPSTGRKK
jgi:autophagy-related protein 2